jgi:hypothetical protein
VMSRVSVNFRRILDAINSALEPRVLGSRLDGVTHALLQKKV